MPINEITIGNKTIDLNGLTCITYHHFVGAYIEHKLIFTFSGDRAEESVSSLTDATAAEIFQGFQVASGR
jgi:hypothetical protein